MTDRAAPSSGGPQVPVPSTLDELVVVLADLSLRLASDPVEAGRRCRVLLAAAPEVLSGVLTEATDRSLALPEMNGPKLARLWGVHPHTIYKRSSAQLARKTSS